MLYEEQQEAFAFKFDIVISQKNHTDFLMGAFSNDLLIGICGFIQEKRQKNSHIGTISGMYVTAAFKGQKIGAGLLNATILNAFHNPKLEQITLAVAGQNETAQNLYKKYGFLEYGRLKHYFKYNGNYETQVLMTLTRQDFATTNH